MRITEYRDGSRIDPFDPNTWQPDKHEFRIYGDDLAQKWVVVDEIDCHFLIQWKWNPKPGRRGAFYLRRAVGGNRWRSVDREPVLTLYLHVEIMKRTGIEPPTPEH